MSTNRATLRAGCFSVLQTVQAAHPTLLAHVWDHTPPTFRTPVAFVANVIAQPTIAHDASTRRMEMVAEVHVVNKYVSNNQAADEQDALVDLIVDAFTAAPRGASASSLIEPVSVTGHEEQDVNPNGEAAYYPCSVINVRGSFIEGRL